MEKIVEVKHLTKRYPDFVLDDISFDLPKGCILGLIGENGAGKSTLMKLILNLSKRDSGEILVFGQDHLLMERQIKEEVGVVFDENCFPEELRAKDMNLIMKSIYKKWDSDIFERYLQRFALPYKKKIQAYSRGMKQKLALAVALSHHSKLLLLDEATSGLDAIVRDEILDALLDFIQDEEHSVILSSHIAADLEKIADYILFLHQGKILLYQEKDALLEQYGILKCSAEDFQNLDSRWKKGYRRNKFGVEVLVERKEMEERNMVDPVHLDDILWFFIKGGEE